MRVTSHFTTKLVGLAAIMGSATFSPALAVAQDLPIRGVVRAHTLSSISTDLSVPIKEMVKREGQSFKKNDTLVVFDCARFMAEKKSLLAEKKVQELSHKNNQTLLSHNAIGEYDVLVSKAKVDKAQANIAQVDVRIRQCVLKAPFSGKVDEVLVHQYETPKPGTPYIRILNTGNLEIEFIVPSNWLQWLQVGTKFDFRIDETARNYQGSVSRLGASVDPVSQTVKIKGKFLADAKNVFAGMSGSAQFNRPES